MNTKLRGMYNDIINDRNLKENIPAFFDMAIDKYNTYAAVRLALHYYMYYEMYTDEKDVWGKDIKDLIANVNNIMSEAFIGSKSDDESQDYVKQIDMVRNDLTVRIESLSLYSDFFQIYEYALERVKHRFSETEMLDEDEDFAREVLRYIFEQKDNAITNDRIKEIIGQLPVRITKQKYFDYIRDSLNELLGTQEDILETYIYLVRSSATLGTLDEMKHSYPVLWKSKEKLETLDFKSLEKDEYDTTFKQIQEALVFLEEEFTAYYSLIEAVNELYTILNCTPYVEINKSRDNVQEAAFHIITSINDLFLKDKLEEPSQDIIGRFETLEGFQEDMEYDLLSLEDALYHIDNQHNTLAEQLMEEKRLKVLLNNKDLLSGSLFIDLNKRESNGIVNKERLDKEINKLIMDLTDKFQHVDRNIARAIMANTIDKVPVFFNNHSEVMEYVLYSLNKCTDAAEKYACMTIINDIIHE